jgi:hypothetical protein
LVVAERTYLPLSFVTGVDIGLKNIKGKAQSNKTVRIHVTKKILDKSLLPADQIIPEFINGVPTDVIESNFRFQASGIAQTRRTRCSVLQAGISIGDGINSGTLGLIVTDKTTGKKCVLSNCHVLTSNVVSQPGTVDGAKLPEDIIGKKIRDIFSEVGDAALGEITDERKGIDKTIFGTNIILTDCSYPHDQDVLKKSGKESGITQGKVCSDIGTYKVRDSSYQVKGFLIASLNGSPISTEGDSGSVWFNEDKSHGVGLHIGVDENNNVVAGILQEILSELKATLYL